MIVFVSWCDQDQTLGVYLLKSEHNTEHVSIMISGNSADDQDCVYNGRLWRPQDPVFVLGFNHTAPDERVHVAAEACDAGDSSRHTLASGL